MAVDEMGSTMADLFRRLAACLELGELEDQLADELRRGIPGCTALVRLGSATRAARTTGPRASRGRNFSPADAGVLAVAIERSGKRLGYLGYVNDETLVPHHALATERLAEVAEVAGIPVANSLRHEAALQLAYKDPLTGVYNRRAFGDYLEREVQRATRHERPLALILLDLDGLKRINDTFGHAAGDHALRALGDVLRRSLRRVDIVARLGGDEFAVLCPDTNAAAAQRAAARIRRTLATRRAGRDDNWIALGVSCGVTDVEAGGGDGTRMLELADMDLYRAKHARTRGTGGADLPILALPDGRA